MVTCRHDATRTGLPHPRRAGHAAHRLSPLVAALAAALPLLAPAAPKPAPNTVPVPSASWRVYGTGSAAPVNTPNSQGGIDQTIQQTSAKGIYHWATFDIGEQSSVTFDMAGTGFSALNRVTGSTAPSQIFGKLKATNGGEVLLINANGILFGRGAQVNVGSLVASALNTSDSEFLSSFAQSLTNPLDPALNAAFRYDGASEDFVDSRNYVRVDEGAQLTTASGGRVFLFAKKVENAGTITTPSGQTVLAGGGEIYLKLPSSEDKLYASETNPAVSALRGFLVEVGSGPAAAPEGSDGSATNTATGVISTPRGNTTLVGMAVNQMGRISATTSVSENGSVILRAQGRAGPDVTTMRAQASGALVLGEGSLIEIGVDPTTTADGSAATSTDASGFANSHLDLAGLSVTFERDARIVAPGATVNVRAESLPSYDLDGLRLAGSDQARIVMREGATIDVSGTTGAEASVAREFVTTELLGSNDLRDAPVQKDGLLYRSKVTIDTRDGSPILGDLEGYRANIARTAEERMAEGGTVRLRAEGAVLTEAGSRIDVSGGQMRFTEAQVRETQLIGSDGRLYDLNDAPADLVYTHATNLQKSSLASYDRWGVKVAYGSVTPTRTEAGYTEGRDAGHLAIEAPTLVMQGQLQAGTVQGERQQAGLGAQAHAGSLHLGAVVNRGQDFSTPDTTPNAVLRSFSVTERGPEIDAGLWADPMAAELPADSGMALGLLQAGDFADVAIAADGAVSFGDEGARFWQMADSGSLRLLSSDASVTLAASVRGAHGHVELHSKEWGGRLGPKTSGEVRVAEGVHVDLSGRFVNQALGGRPLDTSATAGGRFEAIGYGVTLGQDSLVDVSGGGHVSTNGHFTGADAGRIALTDVTVEANATQPTLVLGGALHGYSAASHDGQASGGGSLSLSTHHVRISPLGEPGATPGLVLDDGFFNRGGFSSFDINGSMELRVVEGARVAPRVAARQAPADIARLASGHAAEVLDSGTARGLRPEAVSLRLNSTGGDPGRGFGRLWVAEGATLDAGAQGRIALGADNQLRMNGTLRAEGGDVSLRVTGRETEVPNLLWVGEHARIDVSGTRVLQPGGTDGRLEGVVLAGGRISLEAGSGELASHLVLHQDARLDARGASGELDLTTLGEAGLRTTRQQVDSAGGSVVIASNAGLVLEGKVALEGGGTAVDGSLAVALKGVLYDDGSGPRVFQRDIELRSRGDRVTGDLAPGRLPTAIEMGDTVAVIGADWLKASGAADLTLTSAGTLTLADSLDLQLDGQLTLLTRGIRAEPSTDSRLGASQVLVGWNTTDALPSGAPVQPPLPATEGTAALTIQATEGMTLDGKIATQGLGRLVLASGGDLRLQSRDISLTGIAEGGLTTQADLTLVGQRIYAAADTHYTVNAAGHTVRVERPAQAAATTPTAPQSARSELTINAADIVQAGELRAPLGRINLNATDSLVLAAGSVTSVSAAGADILYGTATDTTWTRPNATAMAAPPDKRISLSAGSVSTEAGSVVDVSGGGDLLATEFVPGPGGSNNILASSGAYALVPGHAALSSHATTATGAAPAGQQVHIARAITLPDGSRLPAGDYTLLPPDYAMLPGAFLLRPASAPTALASGTSIAQTDGSVLLGATLGRAGSTAAPGLPQTWQLMSKATLLKYSEIREHRANEHFTAIAARAGTAAPEVPNDAGAVVIRAAQAQLEGSGRYGAATDAQGQPLGQAGRTEIVASRIQIDAEAAPADDGTLHLSVASLNQLAGGTVVLGATSTGIAADATGERVATLQAEASEIVFNQGDAAITVGDLVAAATGSITVNDGAHFQATAGGPASGSLGYTIQGDGAALRVSGHGSGSFTRTGAQGLAGSLSVGQGTRMEGAQLVLDSSASSRVAADAQLAGRQITLAAGQLQAGGQAAEGALLLTPELMAQVSSAERLTLRGYEAITLGGGTTLGQPALQSLVLDTAHLRHGQQAGTAGVVAGEITLTNSSGGAAAPAAAGDGVLSLQATRSAGGSGWLRTTGGAVAVDGVRELHLQAQTGLGLAGETQLSAAGDVRLDTPGIVAGGLAGELALSTTGALRIDNSFGTGPATSLDGGVFTATASHIEQASRIVLPSGRIELHGRDGVVLTSGSRTDAAGRTATIDGVAVDQAGGVVALTSSNGDVTLQSGARVDVSGAGQAGAGGHLALDASHGTVTLDGGFTGTSGSDARGAHFSIDAGHDLDTARLAARLAGQFSGQLQLRQREGDLALGPGQHYAAERIAVSADGGRLTVLGTLDASGAQGGTIQLDAGGDLSLQGSARLLAQATSATGDGGRIDLGSRDGRLQTAAGTLVSLAGGADGEAEGGRLTLRANRTGPALDDVAIGALNGRIEGARRIDVQAVKVYEGIHSIHDTQDGGGTLSYATVNADNRAFIGARGEAADAIARRLAGGNQQVLDALKVHAEAEVRAEGDLAITAATDWVLPTESLEVAQQPRGRSDHVGDSSLTLRAAGALDVPRGLSSGFDASGNPGSDQGGSIRLVAGADLSAASPSATGAVTADLRLSREQLASNRATPMLIQTTTGDITLAASGNVDFTRGNVAVQTTGGTRDAAADAIGWNDGRGLDADRHAFRRDGGDIRVVAGVDVLSREAASIGQASLFGSVGASGGDPGTRAWFSNPTAGTSLPRGLGSFGGGDVAVEAGRDVRSLIAIAPSSGYVTGDGEGARFGGGDVSLHAGRDVVNGVVSAGGERIDVSAGRDLAFEPVPPTTPGMRLYTENSDTRLAARRHLDVGYIASRFLSTNLDGWLAGLDNEASLHAVAAAGDVTLRQVPTFRDGDIALLPASFFAAAPSGDLALGDPLGFSTQALQQPHAAGQFQLLAAGSVAMNVGLQVNASRTASDTPAHLDRAQLVSELQVTDQASAEARWSDGAALDQTSRSPVHLAAAGGDLQFGQGGGIQSARPIRLVAGGDVTTTSGGAIQAQHQSGQELSLLQAGRDIRLGSWVVRLGGEGDLVVMAGRDIDLGRAATIEGSGLMAVGNTDNTLLPARAAAVTLVAGLKADGSDYQAAVAAGFHVLGSAGLSRHAGDLYALLAGEGSVPSLGSAEAKAFEALDSAAQLDQLRTLMGQAAYDQALASFVRGLPENGHLSDSAAVAAFASQSQARRDAAPAALLAGLLDDQPAATRQAFVLQVAQADSPRTAAGLQAWIKAKTGRELSLADAALAFEALPLERQVGWLNQVLVDELRSHGRAAATSSGYDAEAAYLRGYQAINTVFAIDRPAAGGDIRLPSTQVKVLQAADVSLLDKTATERALTLGAITLMAPSGGVNAGEVGSTSQKPNNLGVVTVAGGDVAGVVERDFMVNQSRVFTLAEGDILLWASEGDIDAGRGAKTVSGAPAPVLRLNAATGRLELDTSGSFTGSGIAVLDAKSELDLYAPAGAIDAGEAGIKSRGNAFLGAQVVRGGDNLQFGGSAVGAPIAAPTVNPAASLSAAAATAAPTAGGDDEDERRRKRLARRTLLLEFLGFGRG